jgi:FSR family fosmidomycin resistance protein-like MFS transporter
LQIWLLIMLSLGHLMTDLCGGVLPILLPVLKDEFHLTYTALGVIVLLANLSSSVVQPLFGMWSDRISSRWLLPMGLLLAALGIAYVGIAPSYLLLLVGVFVSGIGTAAYHPEGSKQSFLISGAQKATAMAVYSVGGNIGFGLGPLMASLLLAVNGTKGTLWLLLPVLMVALLINYYLPTLDKLCQKIGTANQTKAEVKARPPAGRRAWLAVTILIMIVTLRSLIHIGMSTYIPLFYVNYLHTRPALASIILTVFLMAGALGTVVGGPLADRWGRKTVLALSFLLVLPALWFFPYSRGIWSAVLAGWSGFALISTFSVTVVYAQELLPEHVGLASGLMMGFSVGLGSLGALAYGAIADAQGVLSVLKLLSLLPVPALLLTMLLPARRKALQVLKTVE